MTTPGWYNDEQDGRLARWHDGSGWTAHTLVIADWQGQNEPPPPAGNVLTAADDDPVTWDYDDTTVVPDDSAWDGLWPDEYDSDDDTMVPRHSAGPAGVDWTRYAIPAAVVGILLLAFLVLQLGKDEGNGGDKDLDAQETSTLGDIDEAVAEARRGLALSIGVTDGDLKALIRGLCDVAEGGPTDAVAHDAALAVSTADQLAPVLAAAARGSADYCPAATGAGGAVDEIAAAAALQLAQTQTTLPDGSTVVDPASDGSGASSSSKKPGSTTQPTAAAGSTVKRTETRSNTSTNNTTPTGNVTRGDEDVVGNTNTNNQTVKTTITAPPPTSTTTTTAEPTTGAEPT